MNPKVMQGIADELNLYVDHLVDRAEQCEPSPRYIEELSARAVRAVTQIANLEHLAVDVVCRFVDDATGKALRKFPAALESVSRELLADAQRDHPATELSDAEKAGLRLANHVLQYTTQPAVDVPRESEDAQG